MGKKSRSKRNGAVNPKAAPGLGPSNQTASASGAAGPGGAGDWRECAVPVLPEESVRRKTLICGLIMLGLAGVVVWIYLRVGGFGFVYDDFFYIVYNDNITKGFNLRSIAWTIKSVYVANWHPLTWFVHLVAFSLFGMKPFGHHMVNVFLHIANALLVFGLLNKMTGARYKSAFVAALFAFHPLRVESVAWIAELKDVMSAFFGFLAMWAYLRYVAKRSAGRYLPVFFLMAISLMAKPMLVTLPFVLLLLDYWPLDRLRTPPYGGTSGKGGGGIVKSTLTARLTPACLLWEKAPLFLLAGISSVVTMFAQTISIGQVPMGYRLVNAIVSYVGYLKLIFWPSGLAALYPYQLTLTYTQVGFSLLGLATISGLAFWKRKRFPFLVMGWLWYLGMLVPVIGLVQVGLQSMADRYTSLPCLGLFIAIVWGLDAATENRPEVKRLLAAGGCAAVICLAILARMQTAYWKDQTTLFTRALAVTENNFLAHNNLGCELLNAGKTDMAAEHFRAAVKINPGYSDAHDNLGKALQVQGKMDEAVEEFKAALKANPDLYDALKNLGKALQAQGKLDEAVDRFKAAAIMNPQDCDILNNLGNVLQSQGKLDDAFTYYKAAFNIDPNYFQAHNNMGTILGMQGKLDEAIEQFRIAARIRPEDSDAVKNLGIALQSQGKLDEAIDSFNASLRIKPDDAEVLNNLGSALQAQGKLDEAIAHYRAAIEKQPDLEVARRNLDVALQAQLASQAKEKQ